MKKINLKSLSAVLQVPVVVTGAGEEDWDQGMGTRSRSPPRPPTCARVPAAVRDSPKRNPPVFPHAVLF